MTTQASKLFPKLYQGKEDNGGYLSKNERAANNTHPSHRGRIYLAGVGWYWIRGWTHENRRGRYLILSAEPMSDTDAQTYCAPSGTTNAQQRARREEHAPRSIPKHTEQDLLDEPQNVSGGEDYADEDIPF